MKRPVRRSARGRSRLAWRAAVALGLLPVAMLAGCRSRPTEASAAASASAVRLAPPPPLDTSWEQNPGHPLAPKDKAPDFEGIAHTGMRVRLSAFLEKPVVVFFYGADKSESATKEVRSFRDAWLRFIPVCGMILGVSSDDRVLHRDFATAEELPFLLVADEGGKIARAFGVPRAGDRDQPTTFIVGKDGVVTHVFPAPSPDGHAAEILAALGVAP